MQTFTKLCECGKPAHPAYGDRCEDCFADAAGRLKNIYKEDEKAEGAEENAHLLKRIDDFFGRHIVNALARSGIEYLDDLVNCTEFQLLKMPRIGEGTIDVIKQVLQGLGLSLCQPEPEKQN